MEKSQAKSGTGFQPRAWDVWVAVIPLLALAPMLLYELAALWSREHMRFFPLPLLGLLILLVLNRRQAQQTRHPIRGWTAIALFGLGTLIYLYSLWSFAPWLAHLAAIFVFTAWALGRFGGRHWAGVLGWTALAASTLPLPWGWDVGLLNSLQTAATWCTTKALDALAIPCLQNGSLLETRGLKLIAGEICGGLGSLYAFVAFAILLSLLLHKSFIVALSTVLSVPLWVLVGNFLRLFGIVIVHEVWNRDLSNGLDFLMLEVGSNLLMLLLIWATLRLLTRIFEPLPVADAEFGPIFAGLNKLFCWPQPDPFEDLEPEDEYEKKRFLRRQAEKEAQRRTYPDFIWTSHAVATWSVRVVALLLLVGALVPLRALSSQGLSQLNFGVPRLSAAQVEQLAQEDTLPATLDGGWQRVNFSAERRSPRSQFGEFSLTWRFHSDERQFLASVDLPFLGWHDPVAARALEGWKAEQTTITREDGWPWAEAELENELGGKAYVFYCLFTPDGKPFTHVPPQVGAEGSTGQPGQEAEEEQPAEEQQPQQSTTAVTYQFQLFSESGVELSRAERSGLREKFLQLRDAFRQP